MVITSQNDFTVELSVADGVVEGLGNFHAALCIRVQDAGLRAHHQLVFLCAFDPTDVVGHLLLDFLRCIGFETLEHLAGNGIGGGQVGWIARATYPAEGSKSVIKTHGSHDVLHVAGITELVPVIACKVCACAGSFQQEGIPVVKEVGAFGRVAVDRIGVAAQGGAHVLFERGRVVGHHGIGRFEAQSSGVIPSGPRVVQRGLVRSQIHIDALGVQAFPHVHDIAHVSKGAGGFFGLRLAHTGHQYVQVFGDFIHPALFVALVGCRRVHLCGDGYTAGNVGCFGLGPAHAPQAGGHKQFALQAFAVLGHLATCVEHSDGGAVYNALRTNVHVASCGHLTVLGHPQGVEFFPVVRLAVVGDHHPVGHHHARCVFVRRKQAQRMAAVHHQGLLLGHLSEVMHHQPVLRPVLEDCPVAAVGDQLVRVLRHSRVQVVLDHQHDGRRLFGFARVPIDGARQHGVSGAQPVHVDASVIGQFLGEFRSKNGVLFGREVAQGIGQGQFFFTGRKDVFAARCVRNVGVQRTGLGEFSGQSFGHQGLKFRSGHGRLLDGWVHAAKL